jgi:catalase
MQGGFTSYHERIDATKIRERSRSFFDFFSQATLFFNSQSEPEKNHIVDALSFELGKVETVAIRERMLHILTYVDKGLASQVAYNLGLSIPKNIGLLNTGIPADADPKSYQPIIKKSTQEKSAALSMAGYVMDTIKTRKVAILAADDVDEKSLTAMKKRLSAEGAVAEIISVRLGTIEGNAGTLINVDKSLLTTASVLYDAVYVPGGTNSVATLAADPDAIHFLNEAFKHCKAIAADMGAMQVLEATYFSKKLLKPGDNTGASEDGVIIDGNAKVLANNFIEAIKLHRFWQREKPRKVPA